MFPTLESLTDEEEKSFAHPKGYYTEQRSRIGSIAKTVKPKLILELGTWQGYGALLLAQSSGGHVVTVDFLLESYIAGMRQAIEGNCFIHPVFMDGRQYVTEVATLLPFDFCHLDMDHNYNSSVLILSILTKMESMQNIVVHDCDSINHDEYRACTDFLSKDSTWDGDCKYGVYWLRKLHS